MYEPLLDLSATWDGCSDINPPGSAAAVADHIVITLNGNCTLTKKAQTIEVSILYYTMYVYIIINALNNTELTHL